MVIRLSKEDYSKLKSLRNRTAISLPILCRALLKRAMSQNSLEDSLGNFNLQLSNAQAVVFLSYRVKKVFSLMGKDISNMEIVENLNISVQTVKNHVTSIMRKLEFNSRIQVALLSLQHNMLQETVVDTDFKPAEAASIDLPVR